jgi:hypothetical protein
MVLQRFILVLVLFVIGSVSSHAAPISQYLPKDHRYDAAIPDPAATLGFEIGARHARHAQLLDYFNTLSAKSARVMLTDIGRTEQHRKQVLVTISSPENLARLDSLLAQHQDINNAQSEKPLVIWLGYSVHGDEISGANAAMVVAYHLAASQNQAITELLANTVIVMEPSINPDGMDRFVNWVTTHSNTTANTDANDIEHHQGWPTGRTNHFWFDLNRDWLLLSQKESRNRIKYFHRYQPHVLGDFHEMGANGSYFFQPGIPSRTHTLTPKGNIELTQELAKHHAKALDQEDNLYYSEESYDDFYYGKGSTYPDINASVGILFEQASSRGMQQDSDNGVLTFEFGIKNHVLTSLSTISGAWQNRQKLKEYRHDFYQQGLQLAKKQKFNGYLLREPKDKYRLNSFLEKLSQHQIKVYPLVKDYRYQDRLFSKNDSFYVPLEQPQYRMVQALFNQDTNFRDNTFYDVSGWTLPLAMNIEFHAIERSWGLELSSKPWQASASTKTILDNKAYAYVFEWHDYLAPKLLNKLLNQGIKLKLATKSFSSLIHGKSHRFDRGSIVIPAGIQTLANWRERLNQLSQQTNIEMFSVNTGLTAQGIDLGSSSLVLLKPVKVLMLGGKEISQYEAGEIRFYLDKTLNIPLTIVEQARFNKLDISNYSHVVLVDGNYNSMPASVSHKLTAWAKQGGVIFAQKRAAKWLSDKDILQADFISEKQIDQLFDTSELSYQDKDALAGRKRIAGAIYQVHLDTSHPLAYGYNEKELPLFRNSTLIMEMPSKPFITVAQYSPSPLLSGYTDRNLVNSIANNAALIGHDLGLGKVIATSDNLVFRGYWHGTAKLLANSLFFAHAFAAPLEQ